MKGEILRTIEYTFSWKNGGKPRMGTALDWGLSEALLRCYENNFYDWTHITITKLKCNQRKDHYPDACWHYHYTILNSEDYR